MEPKLLPRVSRRKLLERSGLGMGAVALAGLLRGESRVPMDLAPRPTHFAPRAKAVIQFVMNGGPSQMDLLDPKPLLTKYSGQPHPDGVEIHQPNNANILMGSPFQFRRAGQSGIEISEALPQLATIADDLCVVRSMYSEHNNHPEGLNQLQTCRIFPGRPVMGAWISYALGSVNQNLPAFVVLRDPEGYPVSGKQLWSSGWLPALFQGVEFNPTGPPVRNLSPVRPLPPGVQREQLDFLAMINKRHLAGHIGETELEARIENYELAARMQLAAAEVLDLTRESEATRKLYGLDNALTEAFGARCLMARRLVESGVRFVQVFSGPGQPWDTHSGIKTNLPKICAKTDLPVVGLIKDLQSRGLFDSTIVLWSGEFGRLPTTQNSDGRDHNRNAFSLFLAGGGFRRGLAYGETDEFGYKATVNRVGTPDLQATLLHALGLDHERLTFPHGGRVETPTDATVTGAKPLKALLA
ncbi:MAG: DUF1501 domain-containing protein [Acidobacteria bacterium]|nr:DUF1501 domain-containing protein [Acidobacteriota bacterium]